MGVLSSKTRRLSIECKNVFYFTAYGMYLVISTLSASFYLRYFIGPVYTIVLCTSLALLVVHQLAHGKIMARQIVWILVTILGFAIVYPISGLGVAILFPFIIFGIGIEFDEIARFTETIELMVLLFVVITSKIGIVENFIYNVSGRYREYLGFRYALYPMMVLFNIMTLNLYVNRNKRHNRLLPFLLILDLYLFVKTNSRLVFVTSLLLVVAFYTVKQWESIFEQGIFRCLICGIYIWTYALSFLISKGYNELVLWMNKLNNFLGERISMAQISLAEFGLGAWRVHTEWVGMGLDVYGNREVGTPLYVDNFYVKISQQYGLVFVAILLLIFTASIVIAYRDQDWHMVIILSMFALHGLIDDLMLSIVYNTSLIYIGTKVTRSMRDITVIPGKWGGQHIGASNYCMHCWPQFATHSNIVEAA